ncbi:MAG: low-complexity tail membrane protein [Oscillatoriales cyanobacterium]|uniref:Low-complexity tail membrane protein n=1 Tax=Microcoleus anatoxicus PTRS2 TaxID=2705321 RepID=A0ABU8YMM5_9CYAN|nr:MAG: low-complexity tail membrane protein [Oscillatoriales cyanobacterium]TAD94768.1 MAG: low-complexity tail membrane protein [Oscillatoriales cyanobacterium]TAE00831.1 MAG: low-complexity tail membrane protein [Oscillatoriales cyanobacterium]TAF04808.1 MAG: low-complexity tail membrane protein [Oscillatoriales cyanobacterium]TAF43075.1 MAG: low-complexity tail membrane protein [Oscillatoriales cyanobacterium]
MRSFWSEPFLWIHLAGLAALPIFLGLCWLGLAVGSPLLPVWLEVFLVGAAGIGPVLWMQWFRPFYIFSILVVAVKPQNLTNAQQRILAGFKSRLNQGLALFLAILLAVILWQLYRFSPLAASVAPFPPQWRLAGLLLAAWAFLASNLFLQVPASVLAVLLTPESEFAGRQPHVLDQVGLDFTIAGWLVDRILPTFAEAEDRGKPEEGDGI